MREDENQSSGTSKGEGMRQRNSKTNYKNGTIPQMLRGKRGKSVGTIKWQRAVREFTRGLYFASFIDAAERE